ncbi:MAG: hypothetical protein HC796_02785 [Synechococcaceae cyanobacterium RL_1_2]|nr:hypothetical protein [Synechococcaceae cyanobacterium RL_1_2]
MAIKQSFLILVVTTAGLLWPLGSQSATIAPGLYNSDYGLENLPNTDNPSDYALGLYQQGQFKAAKSIWHRLYQEANSATTSMGRHYILIIWRSRTMT